MPRIFNFYVINPDRLADEDEGAVERHGARWAQIETKAFSFGDACDEIDRLLGERVIGGQIGEFSLEQAAALYEGLAAASPEMLARIEDDDAVDTAYWALRDTAQEAVRRRYAMVIVMDG